MAAYIWCGRLGTQAVEGSAKSYKIRAGPRCGKQSCAPGPANWLKLGCSRFDWGLSETHSLPCASKSLQSISDFKRTADQLLIPLFSRATASPTRSKIHSRLFEIDREVHIFHIRPVSRRCAINEFGFRP